MTAKDTEFYDIDLTSPQGLSLLFRVGMWWRIFYGVIRIVLALALLKMVGSPLTEFIQNLIAHPLTGVLSEYVLEMVLLFLSQYNYTVTYFLAGYFLFWGSIEIILSLCLLKQILWAFPLTMGLIVLFILYSIVRFTETESLTLLGVILFDCAILYLVRHEYEVLKKRLA